MTAIIDGKLGLAINLVLHSVIELHLQTGVMINKQRVQFPEEKKNKRPVDQCASCSPCKQ